MLKISVLSHLSENCLVSRDNQSYDYLKKKKKNGSVQWGQNRFLCIPIGYFAFYVIYSFIYSFISLFIFKLVLNSRVGLWEPILPESTMSKHRPRRRWETDHTHAWRRSSGCSRTPQSRLLKQTDTHLKNCHCGCFVAMINESPDRFLSISVASDSDQKCFFV